MALINGLGPGIGKVCQIMRDEFAGKFVYC